MGTVTSKLRGANICIGRGMDDKTVSCIGRGMDNKTVSCIGRGMDDKTVSCQ